MRALTMLFCSLLMATGAVASAYAQTQVPADRTTACVAMIQQTKFMDSWLRDPEGARFKVIAEALEHEPRICQLFQALVYGESGSKPVFPSWIRVTEADPERLVGKIRSTTLSKSGDAADINRAFQAAFTAFRQLDGSPKKIVLFLSDGAFTMGSVDQFFRETLSAFVHSDTRVYTLNFYFLHRQSLQDIAQATGGLYFSGNLGNPAVRQAALERIAADLRVSEPATPKEGQEPETPPTEKAPLREFLDPITAGISMNVSAEPFYWADAPARIEAVLAYKGELLGQSGLPVELGDDRGRLWIEAVYATVTGERHALVHQQDRRYAGELALPAGIHSLVLTAEARIQRDSEEEQIRVETQKTLVVKQRPVVALAAEPGPYTRHQPVKLTLTVIQGDPTDLTETPKVRVLPAQGEPSYLNPVPGRDAGRFTVTHRPATEGTFRYFVAGGESYRAASNASELVVEVAPPALVVPKRVSLTSGACFAVRSTLFAPDEAVLAVATDGQLRADKERLQLTPAKGEARLCLESVRGFSLIERLQRKGFHSEVRFIDVTGTFGEREFAVAVDVASPFPLMLTVGAAVLGVALIAIPIVFIGGRRESAGAFRGRKLTRRLQVGGQVRIGRGVDPDKGWRLPGREIGEVHLSILRTEEGYRVRVEAGLELYKNGKKVRLEEPLAQGDVLEFGEYKSRVSIQGEDLTLKILDI